MSLNATREEDAGNEEEDNEKIILNAIQRRRRIHLQSLLKQFVESRKMSRSVLMTHLSNLVKKGEIGKLKEGRLSIYCIRGESLPEKMPISEADIFLLDECKKLVSEMIASGLIWPDTWGEENPNDTKCKFPDRLGEGYHDDRVNLEWIGRRIERRFELSQRAYTLWYAIDQHQDYRDYKIPLPYSYLEKRNWEEEKYDVMGQWVDGSVCLSSGSLYDWITYFMKIIDYLSREVGKVEGKKPPKAKARTAALAPDRSH